MQSISGDMDYQELSNAPGGRVANILENNSASSTSVADLHTNNFTPGYKVRERHAQKDYENICS